MSVFLSLGASESISVFLSMSLQLSECTAILQLYDNSVYQVGGPGGVRHLPTCDRQGRYHIEGTLQVADKSAIKEMTAMLTPLIKALGQARKAFLAPLTRYWIRPCCDNVNHHLNYSSPTYLPALGASVFRLRQYQGCPLHEAHRKLPGGLCQQVDGHRSTSE
jgi:hypothetical protein